MSTSKTWVEKTASQKIIDDLARELGISALMAKLLVIRKVVDKSSAEEFLSPSLKNLTEPLKFAGMSDAVVRIAQAVLSGEKIGIFGDYDVDGVCSTAILEQFLTSLGAQVCATLPNRLREGYGLSKAGVDRLHAAGATLLITADCGILAHEQVDYANLLGFEVVVVDHHNAGLDLPRAKAVVNPKRSDCESGSDYLCAAGVTFFLCMALRRRLRELGFFKDSEPDLRDLLDLVALATVCDVVPLIKHNRALVGAGLKAIKSGKRVGIAALISACGVDPNKISSTNLGFHLGPRINAAGRLEDASMALKLLGEKDLVQASSLSMMLNQTNVERKEIEAATVEEACALLDALDEIPKAIVLYMEHWHPGVVGIVASRIAERYHRPSIIIGEHGKGSGRSIRGIDLHAMVLQASESLAGFGGHAHAIGLSLGPAGVDCFREALLGVVGEQVAQDIFSKQVFYDAELDLADAHLSLVEELAQLEPFGAQNPYPVMRINRCFMRNLRKLNGGHLKGELENSSGFAAFIGFRMDIPDELAGCALDVLAVVEKNEWQGRMSLQLRLIDYQQSA